VPDGKKWLLEHVPFYAKWYRFFRNYPPLISALLPAS
jgi:hypothetical protein